MGEGEHGHIVGSFNSSKLGGREIEESGFQEKGGGHLEAWSGGGKIKLHFFGRSAVMGEFDHEILRKTLEEVLDKEKFDWIIGERLRILKKKD
ncbi:TPA: hypothetical protein HA244_01135 [Candidatus Micrarchaeota archaeon]|nr:hypothetical protein [Candidatus Micrarchaeota archaeon]